MKLKFKKLIISGAIPLIIFGFKPADNTKTNLSYVDPYIGGIGHLLHPTRPNVQLPNQMIRMHPLRADFLDDQISFFPLTMISHRKGELFGVLPGTGSAEARTWKECQTYDHDLEIARPYYFSTYLIDEDIKAEFTPGNKVGLFRFTFPPKSGKTLRFQINQEGHWDIVSKNAISGEEQFFGMKAFVYGEFNQDGKTILKDEPRLIKKTNKIRQEPTAWIEFS